MHKLFVAAAVGVAACVSPLSIEAAGRYLSLMVFWNLVVTVANGQGRCLGAIYGGAGDGGRVPRRGRGGTNSRHRFQN